jgi:hypothetical protein
LKSHSFTTIDCSDDELDNITSSEDLTGNQLGGSSDFAGPYEISNHSEGEDIKIDRTDQLSATCPQLSASEKTSLSPISGELSPSESVNPLYTTSLYIDSLIPTFDMALDETAEVMIILGVDRTAGRSNALYVDDSASSEKRTSVNNGRYQTVLDADVTRGNDDVTIVAPVSYKTSPVQVSPVEEEHSRVLSGASSDVEEDEKQRLKGRKSGVRWSSRSLPDLSDHQILHSMMQHSAFMSVSKNFS